MVYLFNLFCVLTSFVAMEIVAWSTHKYIMHGLLWHMHEDHHRPHDKKVEKNDFFALVFAIPAWLFIMFGIMDGNDYKLYIGIGITLYGICYVLVHDGLIHQRFKIFNQTDNPWLIALRKGHKVHHKQLDKSNTECFGMLVVPLKYYREARAYTRNLKKRNLN
ncbi:MAG TPA: sterol desaturase family protein [Chryseolinea sp.]|nr:sterol desaturase family protein [Chryseolinea sp.]HPH46055.1 sterol desaturase family protein [Chryseolinea sp.]